MTPDKVEAALGVLSAIVDKTNWQPDIDAGTEALSVLTEALAAKDAELARYRPIGCVDHGRVGELNLYVATWDLPDGADLYYFDNEGISHDR